MVTPVAFWRRSLITCVFPSSPPLSRGPRVHGVCLLGLGFRMYEFPLVATDRLPCVLIAPWTVRQVV